MKSENRPPETNEFKMVTVRPATYRQAKMFCARTGITMVEIVTQAIDEFLQRMDKDASHAS